MKTTIPLRAQDYDRQSIVNNARHLDLLEAARWDWAQGSRFLDRLPAEHEVLTTGIAIRYHKAITWEPQRDVVIETRLGDVGTYKLQLLQTIRNETEDTVFSEAVVDVVVYNMAENRAVPHHVTAPV